MSIGAMGPAGDVYAGSVSLSSATKAQGHIHASP